MGKTKLLWALFLLISTLWDQSNSPEPPSTDIGLGASPGKYYDVQDFEGYGFNLPKGGGERDLGPDGFPLQIQYKDSNTLLLADVRRTVPESQSFTLSPGETALNIRKLAGENLGGELLEIDVSDFYHRDSGIYSFQYTGTRAETKFYTAVFYCFGETYTAEFIGIGPDQAQSYELAGFAAKSYEDMGGEAHMIGYRPTPGLGARQWDYPCLHNPFAITGYFMDLKAPSEERAKTDYQIQWKDDGIETLVRALLDQPDGPVMSSDLDRFQSLTIHYDPSGFYYIMGNESDGSVQTEDLAIGTLEDLPEFKNVISLDLMFPHQADLTPVSTMTKLEVLQFYTEAGLDTLDWMEPLKNLRYLRISRAYPEITDVRVLGKLEKLDTVLINLPNLTDLSVFAALPNLEEMELGCSEEADTDSLRKAEQIKRLYINGEEVRWEYPE